MDEPLLGAAPSLAKFDRNTGKPLNDAAHAVRQQKVAAKVAVLNNSFTSDGKIGGGGGGGVANLSYASRTTGSIREEMLSQFPQVRENIDLVCEYDASVMSEYAKKITVRMMMIGPPGAGKSSYVNTARAVFSNSAWAEDAEVGQGHDTVTEVASSYPLLPENPDHIRFTDTRGWIGLTDEAVGFFQDISRRNLDGRTADMMAFEDQAREKKSGLARMVTAFSGVDSMHHVVIFFIDAHHIIRQPSTLPNVLDEVVTIYSSFKNAAAGNNAFEPVFFITKVDRVRQDIPTWELRAFVQEIVSRINQHALSKSAEDRAAASAAASAALPGKAGAGGGGGGGAAYMSFQQGGHETPPPGGGGGDGGRGSSSAVSPLIVRPNQFHEIRSCGSREEYDTLVRTNQWIEVQRLHASALAQVLPRATALIRRELQTQSTAQEAAERCQCCAVQ